MGFWDQRLYSRNHFGTSALSLILIFDKCIHSINEIQRFLFLFFSGTDGRTEERPGGRSDGRTVGRSDGRSLGRLVDRSLARSLGRQMFLRMFTYDLSATSSPPNVPTAKAKKQGGRPTKKVKAANCCCVCDVNDSTKDGVRAQRWSSHSLTTSLTVDPFRSLVHVSIGPIYTASFCNCVCLCYDMHPIQSPV